MLAICGLYGLIIGFLGPQSVEALNARSVRLTQAQTVFTALAGVMMVQGAGQVLLMILLFVLLIWGAGARLSRWAQSKPYQPRLVSGLALLVGGTFFIYYWGLSLTFDIGFWGYRLGWYAGQVPT